MAKIDIDKFVLSIMKRCEKSSIKAVWYEEALSDQGLKFDPEKEEIVSIEPEPFEIEKGKFYVCVKRLVNYTVGKVYKAISKDTLESDWEYPQHLSLARECFRPATAEEIIKAEAHKAGYSFQVEPQDSQRMVSAEAKEALLSHSEVTNIRTNFQQNLKWLWLSALFTHNTALFHQKELHHNGVKNYFPSPRRKSGRR